MSLKGKAALVDLGGLDAKEVEPIEVPATVPVAPRRSGVAAITQSISNHHRVQDLEAELAVFKEGNAVVALDPIRVRQSRWKNRHALSFASQRYLDLKAEIEGAGGNVQPIKVRVVGRGVDGQDEYEIVYGRRRLRACLELGFLVKAIIVASMTEEEVFAEMERENRNREDLTPWEQGVMYKDALDAGLYPSQRQLSAKLGVNLGLVSRAIRLASLPEEVVAAFPSPLDLQFRWAEELSDALEKGAVKVIAEAEEIARSGSKPSAKQVLIRLVSAAASDPTAGVAIAREFRVGGKAAGSLTRDRRGGIVLKVKGGALQPSAEKRLLDLIDKLFQE